MKSKFGPIYHKYKFSQKCQFNSILFKPSFGNWNLIHKYKQIDPNIWVQIFD
jgi:hypothetical protein